MIRGTRIDSPLLTGFKPVNAFYKGISDGSKGNLMFMPLVAYEVGTAQRGEQIATASGRIGGMMTYPALAGFAAAGIALIPGVNLAAAGILAGIVAMYPNSLLENSVIRKINWLSQTGKNIRHAELGGSYFDTDYAKNTRQLHMQELSSAIQPARRYLGSEAIFRHR